LNFRIYLDDYKLSLLRIKAVYFKRETRIIIKYQWPNTHTHTHTRARARTHTHVSASCSMASTLHVEFHGENRETEDLRTVSSLPPWAAIHIFLHICVELTSFLPFVDFKEVYANT